jgi:hypothetical protein
VNVISELKAQWDKGLEPQLQGQAHPHNVSGLLKLYLRELPEPLLTFARYKPLLATKALRTVPERIAETKKILDSLPPTHHATAKVVVGLLHNVASFAHINNMKAANLAMVFASNVLRPEVETIEYIVQDTPLVNGVFEFIIENYQLLFGIVSATQTTQSVQQLSASSSASSLSQQQQQQQPKAWQASVTPQSGPPTPEVSTRNLMASAAKALATDDDLPAWAKGGGEGAAMQEQQDKHPTPPATEPVTPAAPLQVAQTTQAAQPAATSASTLDDVWAFREGSYRVITEIYELTNRITAELPNLKSLSEFVYVAAAVWEARLGIGEAIEVQLQMPAIAPLVRV